MVRGLAGQPGGQALDVEQGSQLLQQQGLDLGGGGGVAEGPAAADEQAEAERYPLSLETFWAPQPERPERSSAIGRPSDTQNQPGKTRDLNESKSVRAGIPSKTIVEPVIRPDQGCQ